MHADATFEIKFWNEKPLHEAPELPKITHASVVESLTGDIQGDIVTEYIMTYIHKEEVYFTRVSRVMGRIGGRSGSFVVQGEGTYEAGTASGGFKVVPGSGTGELKGLKGKGVFFAHQSMQGKFTLDYDFEG
jgi:hypothetical protein